MKVLQPTKSIVVKLTEEEATVLCALVGGIPFNFDTKAGHIVRDFFEVLDKNLPGRMESFVDFFEGQVTVKR